MLRHFAAIAGLLLASTLCAGFSRPARAATELVPSQYATIQAAINAAANGDTVLISDGTYTGPGNVDLDFGGRNITVTSQNGAATTIIDCAGSASAQHRGFHLHSGETNAVISGLTIENGYTGGSGNTGSGGGILDSGAGLTIQSCIIKNSTAQYGDGGGLYNDNPGGGDNPITVVNCVFFGNYASYAGGAIFNNGTSADRMAVTNCSFSGNSAGNAGGVENNPYSTGTLTLTNDIFYRDSSGEIVGPIASVTYSDVEGGYAGTGNIDVFPSFFVPAYIGSPPNLHLKAGSSCAGAGTPSGAPATDLDGKNRPNPPSIGAYEAAAVGVAGTTTTLTSSLNPSASGQNVTLTATVTAPGYDVMPTGQIIFTIDGTAKAPVGLGSDATAAYTTSAFSSGSHTITAAYSGDAFYAVSTSPALTQTDNAVGTTTTLTSSLNPSALGQQVKLTANIGTSAVGGVPVGTVTFFVDGLPQTPVSVSNGYYAAYTTSSLNVGSHTITASYSGDAFFGPSTSSALTQTVNQVAITTTTTALASSLNPSAYGQYVILTATVSGSNPTGTVTFTDAATGATLDTEGLYPSGTASFYTYSLAIGSHQIVASYSGDSSNSASKSAVLTQVVGRAATTAAVSSSLNPAVVGQSVTFNGSISATGGPLTGTITFAVDGVAQSPLSINTSYSYQSGAYTSSFSYTVSALSVGSHAVTLAYSGDPNNAPGTSATLTQTVNPVSATTTALISGLNPSAYGQFVFLTATVSGSNPTGTVTFTDTTTGAALGTANLSGGIATLNVYRLATGSHRITASYGGDIGNTASTSPALVQVVSKDGTATSLVSNANPSLGGQSVTVTAELTGASPTDYLYPKPTGTVTFTVDGTAQTPISISSGYYVTFTTSALSIGSHTITAAYSGDANFTPSTSPVLTQTVNQAVTTTTLSSSLNPARYGQQITFTAAVSGSSPSGNVTFTDTTTGAALGTVSLSGSSAASLSIYGLWGGGHQIIASYAGDTNNTLSVSAALTQTVANVSTAMTLASSANPSLLGQSVTVTATVTGTPVGTPTGTVTFTVDGTAPPPVALSSGAASYTTSTLAIGPHTITAAYNGDAIFDPSTAAALTQTVILAPPTQLTAMTGYRQVKLTWAAAASSPAVTYNVSRGTAAGGEGGTPIATGLATAAYADTGLIDGTAYFYTVRTSTGAALSGPSNEASATPALPAPTNLVAVAGAGKVALSWTAPARVPNPTYSLYRGTAPGGETFYKVVGTATSFVNGLVTAGTHYFYTVRAVVGSETSAASGEANAIPTVPVPAAPTHLSATGSGGYILLRWTAAAGTVTSYSVYRGAVSGAETFYKTAGTATSFVNGLVTRGTKYYYTVRALNSSGAGPASNEASATP